MNVGDITQAIGAGDLKAMRHGFRALVDPSEDRVRATAPGFLIVALNRLCAALKDDASVMPTETCAALDLPAGGSYAEGVAKAKRDSARLARRLLEMT